MFKNTTKRFNKIVQSPLSLVVFGQGFNIGEHDMGKQIENLTGQKFNRLTVVKRVENDKYNHIMYLCKCDCGNTKIVRGSHLKAGFIQSCGCLNIEKIIERSVKHKKCYSRLYHIWTGMRSRCYKQYDNRYKNYGGRGITVCDEWKEFQPFYNWAMDNGYDEKAKRGEYMIDRIDVNGNYCPENCRWSNAFEQANNTTKTIHIEYNGKNYTLSELSKMVNISRQTLWSRLYVCKWSIEKTLNTPIKRRIK